MKGDNCMKHINYDIEGWAHRYEVVIGTKTTIHRYDIEADNRQDAMDIARDAFIEDHPNLKLETIIAFINNN